MSSKQLTVVGGGLVGAAIAYGAARCGVSVRVLDQGDTAFRASRGNFGLVWLSSKGGGMPEYSIWTRNAVEQWQGLHQDLLVRTGVDSGLSQKGGFWLGFSDAEVQSRADLLARIDREAGGVPFKMMDNSEIRQFLPDIGPKVVGGSWGSHDGTANPLMLLRALHSGLKMAGADLITGVHVTRIERGAQAGSFVAHSKDGQSWRSDRIVIAAGLGNVDLVDQIGIYAPMVKTRGQVLITERLKPFMNYPTNKVRQTSEGTVQIGSTSEDVGFDDGTTVEKIDSLARRAVDTFPALAEARLVRAWGALRPLSPDGYPIYQESTSCPGAFVVTCHSGVTLAAIHANVLGPWMGGLRDAPAEVAKFTSARFLEKNVRFTSDH